MRNMVGINTRIPKCILKNLYTGEKFTGNVGKHRLGTKQGLKQE